MRLIHRAPEGETKEYYAYHELPPSSREIKPHPYCIEFGMRIKMLQKTKRQTLSRFFPNDFCRVTPALADEISKAARVLPKAKLREIRGAIAETY